MKSRILACAGMALALTAGAHAGLVVGPPAPVGPFSAPGRWSTTDLKTGDPLPSGETTVNQVEVKWQIGNYLSDGLRIYGLVCKPKSLPPPYPVAILNHGLAKVWVGVEQAQIESEKMRAELEEAQVGIEETQKGPGHWIFPAIADFGMTGCTKMASLGWLTAISTYRGEFISEPLSYSVRAAATINAADHIIPPQPLLHRFTATSDGHLELCYGEVDDVLNLLAAVRGLPDANPKQVLMWGHSHGSCITERAIERGAPVQIAVSIDGPTDIATWFANRPAPVWAPTSADQDARSTALVVNHPTTLASVRFLRIQATGDVIVPPEQGCELAAKIPNIVSYYVEAGLILRHGLGPCAKYPVLWQHEPLPDQVAGKQWVSPTFLMYEGSGHVMILPKSWPEVRNFVNTYTKNEGWHASMPFIFSVMEN